MAHICQGSLNDFRMSFSCNFSVAIALLFL